MWRRGRSWWDPGRVGRGGFSVASVEGKKKVNKMSMYTIERIRKTVFLSVALILCILLTIRAVSVYDNFLSRNAWEDTYDKVAATNFSSPVNYEKAKYSLALEAEGKAKWVIAMALYGNSPRYTFGALENAVIVLRDWPQWTLRIYHDHTVPSNVLNQLSALNVELVRIHSEKSDSRGMFWRFLILNDASVSRFIIRDCDSRLTRRDYLTVGDWVRSKYYFHTIHDHPNHGTEIMGGMWGAVGGLINPTIINKWMGVSRPKVEKNDDQVWLTRELWPVVRNFTLMHASWFCDIYLAGEVKPIPVRRQNYADFIGNAYMPENNYQGGENREKCPKRCRADISWDHC